MAADALSDEPRDGDDVLLIINLNIDWYNVTFYYSVCDESLSL